MSSLRLVPPEVSPEFSPEGRPQDTTTAPAAGDALAAQVPTAEVPGGLADELRWQADHCRPSAPLYGVLLDHAAEDAKAGGVVAELLAPYATDPLARQGATMPGLRLLAAVHQLVLTQRLPDLAPYYPSVGGIEEPEDAWPAFHAALTDHVSEITELLTQPVQTNEPGRAAALFGGLLVVAHRTGLPIRLLEIGASAGLNLRADHFSYRVRGTLLGDPASPVLLDEPWRGVPRGVPLTTPVRVVERRGCDPHPLDPTDEADQLHLKSLVWAPDVVRMARLGKALQLAAHVPAPVDQASADSWLAAQLAVSTPGMVTVVWHSMVRQYVDPDEWARVGDTIIHTGQFATGDAPLAYLALEPDPDAGAMPPYRLRLAFWPEEVVETLATVAAHGIPTRWTMPL